jgi:hypothetical protein
VARIARALNEAGIPCPSAADPARNPHRAAAGWTLGAVTAILENPRYTGRQVWNRQRTDTELVDPANVTLGHRSVHRWNLPDGWVISSRLAHPALVSEDDFVAAQDVNAARGPVPQDEPVLRRYLLAGLLACGVCGRRMESAWSNGKPAYRCRHGHTSAMAPDPARPKNTYIREDKLLPHLPALHLLLTTPAVRARRRIGRIIAAWPSFALTASYELLTRQVRGSVPEDGQPSCQVGGQDPATGLAVRAAVYRAGSEDVPGPGREVQRQAWQWALANRASDGTLPAGREIARQFGRRERWGRLVKSAGLAGEFAELIGQAASVPGSVKASRWSPKSAMISRRPPRAST